MPNATNGSPSFITPVLSVTSRRLDSLRLNPKSPRAHSRTQLRQLARSIKTFGYNVPVLIDAQDNVIAGHARVLACRELGYTDVPTICLQHLTPAQAQAFMIADNRLAENSTWDDRLLAVNLQELSVLNLDFSLDVTGFESAEVDLRIEQLRQGPDDKDDAVELPPPDAVPVSQPGDLWSLGPHRILCGNALLATNYDLLLAGRKADVVFTDPPYNVKIEGHVIGNGKLRHREFAMAAGEMSVPQFTAFLQQVCHQLIDASTDGSIHFICMDWRHLPELLSAAAAYELKNLCVWDKGNAGMGSLYRSQHELVLVFKNGSASHVNNVQLGKFGRHRANVWRYPGANSFARQTDEGNLLELHPTVKPVALVADALLDCSNRKGRVLDPFLGSGSTLIAAERTGRHCCGMELDPLYVDTAIRRWQRATGDRATHQQSGRHFEQLQAARPLTAVRIAITEE